MHIDSTSNVTSLIQNTKEGAQPQQQGQTNPPAEISKQQSEHTDTVTFTTAATQLQQAEKVIATTPVINSQRVEQVQNAIKNGSFKTNPMQVAEKMLNFETLVNNARTAA